MGLLDWLPWSTTTAPDQLTVRVDSQLGLAEDAESRLDAASVANAISALGTANDKGAAARPNTDYHPLTESELLVLWLNNGIARRICEIPPKEMTRKGWTVSDDSVDPEAMREINRDLKVFENFRWGQTWARLWGGGAALMVVDEEPPTGFTGKPEDLLALPLDPERVRSVKALHVFDGIEATPLRDNLDLFDPAYRDPEFWQFSPRLIGSNAVQMRGLARVHASRVLWFRGARRPPSMRSGVGSGSRTSFPDDSSLQAMWDQLRNLSQVEAGAAVLAQEIRENVLKISGLGNKTASEQKTTILARLKAMVQTKSLLNVLLMSQEDEWESKVNSPAGYDALSAPAMAMLSAATGIPQTILFGFAPAGFNTDNESGRQQFDRLISSEQSAIRPLLERFYTIVFASKEGPTAGVIPDDWSITFLPLDEVSQKEEADTRKVTAETDVMLVREQILSAKRVRESRYGPDGYQFEIQPVAVPDGEVDDLGVAAEDLAAVSGVEAESIVASDVTLPNGAQVQAAIGIVRLVAAQQLPRSTGIGMLGEFFGMPEERAERLMGEVGRGFRLSPEESARVDAALVARRAALNSDEAVWLSMVPRSESALARVSALQQAASSALGRPLETRGVPHVTVLFVGPVEDAALLSVLESTMEAMGDVRGPLPIVPERIEAFDPDGDGRSAVVLRLECGGLEGVHSRLLRALAPMVSAPQFPTFKAHLTLGWVEGDVDQGALAEIDVWAGSEFEPVAMVDRVVVMRGGEIIGEAKMSRMDAVDGPENREPAGK